MKSTELKHKLSQLNRQYKLDLTKIDLETDRQLELLEVKFEASYITEEDYKSELIKVHEQQARNKVSKLEVFQGLLKEVRNG